MIRNRKKRELILLSGISITPHFLGEYALVYIQHRTTALLTHAKLQENGNASETKRRLCTQQPPSPQYHQQNSCLPIIVQPTFLCYHRGFINYPPSVHQYMNCKYSATVKWIGAIAVPTKEEPKFAAFQQISWSEQQVE